MPRSLRKSGFAAAQAGLDHVRAANVLLEAGHAGQSLFISVAAAEEFGKALANWTCLIAGWQPPMWLASHPDKAAFASLAAAVLDLAEEGVFDIDLRTTSGTAAFFAEIIWNSNAPEVLKSRKHRNASELSNLLLGEDHGPKVNRLDGSIQEDRAALWREVQHGWVGAVGRTPFTPMFRDFGLYSDTLDNGATTSPTDVADSSAREVFMKAADLRRLVMAISEHFADDESTTRLIAALPEAPY